MLGGAALASVFLFKVSYVARESMVGLAALCIVYCAVLLLLTLGYLIFRGTAWVFSWLLLQTQYRNRVAGGWVYVLSQPRPAIAERTSRIS
jgi:hypothetical protein